MPRFPQMILFDYGRTLLYEPGFSTLNGEKALFRYVKDNPLGLTPEEIDRFARELFRELDQSRRNGFEVHEYPGLRYKNEYLGLTYSVPMEEAERILWDGMSPGAAMPGAEDMLRFLNARGIRTGVISNLSFSQKALKERLDRLLPDNRFQFVIASSEYVFRKPSPRLFQLALRKAGLAPEEVWFCGDDPVCDVEGAAAVGMFPVWYTNDPDGKGIGERVPGCGHLRIREWAELTALLERLAG